MTHSIRPNTLYPTPGTRHLTPRVAVVGAGVIGVAVAYRLAEKGAKVVLLDGAAPGSGATAASFGLVKAIESESGALFELSRAATQEYRRFAWKLAPAPWYHVDGSLAWFRDPARSAALVARVRWLREWGYAAELLPVSTVLADLEPGLAGAAGLSDPASTVAWFPEEAWVDAAAMTRRLVDVVRNGGGRVLTGPEREVVAIGRDEGRVSSVTLAGGQTIPVDIVLNAAGVNAPHVAQMVSHQLPLLAPRSLTVRAESPHIGVPLHRPVRTDDVAVRPDGPGFLLLTRNLEDNTATIQGTLPLDHPLIVEMQARAVAAIPTLAGARPVAALVRAWPLPPDGAPIVGAVTAIPGYFEAVTDYGVTLAPLIGRSLGDEIVNVGVGMSG